MAVTIAVPISTSGNSALLIGAGYMIVNELALNLAGCGVKPHPADLADLIHRGLAAPTRRGGILDSPRLEYVENGVRRSLSRPPLLQGPDDVMQDPGDDVPWPGRMRAILNVDQRTKLLRVGDTGADRFGVKACGLDVWSGDVQP